MNLKVFNFQYKLHNDIVDIDKLTEHLVSIGYERQYQVESPGDFSVRGGIIDIFPVTEEGVSKAIVLCSRILGVGSAILLGGKIIDMKKLMAVLEERGLSPSATYVLLSTTNIIPQMSKKMNAILDAQRSRGIETDSNVIVRAKAFFPSVGPLLLNSLVSAEERAITLEARAFSAPCKKTKLKEIADTAMDKGMRVVLIGVLILAIGGKIILWIVLK